MLRIAICDDMINICDELKLFLNQYQHKKNIKIQISIFYSGEAFIADSEKNQFDLIFLDIALAQMNGIEVGKYIREKLKNEIIQIIYISSEPNYAVSLFQNRPFHFLLKPLNECDICIIQNTRF